jgi:hypothetical protein
MWAMSVFHWLGDLGAAEEVTQRFVEHADCYSLGPYQASGRGMQGMLALKSGECGRGSGTPTELFGRA